MLESISKYISDDESQAGFVLIFTLNNIYCIWLVETLPIPVTSTTSLASSSLIWVSWSSGIIVRTCPPLVVN